ncbi:type II secretion system minor pseudopilin GspK [Marinomonas sp. THO17]|uniref:type II secretion system minor pseudopilin GspK n=1 Tax=Marinomonas sp. THO17 TaxID=3149048 RepID=UPI00336BECA0
MISRQSGSVLLLALMILAIISGIATNILSGVHKDVVFSQQLQSMSQIHQELLGGEAWAQAWLHKEVGQQEMKAKNNLLIQQRLETDRGEIDIRIFDQNSCFNVNLLHNAAYREVTRLRFEHLSTELGINQDWIDVLTDWLDDNQVLSSNNGKEDDYYLNRVTPYRTADTPLPSIEEWRLIAIPPNQGQALLPYICALPSDVSTLNINRAPDLVIKSYYANVSDEHINQLLTLIHTEPVTDLSILFSDDSIKAANLSASGWRTDSQFFSVLVKLNYQNRPYWLYSKLQKRKGDQMISYYRSFAPIKSLN